MRETRKYLRDVEHCNTTYADHTHDYSQLKLQNRQKPNHYSWIARHTFSHPAGPENCKIL